MRLLFLMPFVMILFQGCSNLKVIASLNDVKFLTAPYISNKTGDYYLTMQFENDTTQYEMLIEQKIQNGKLLFYFAGKTSMPPYLGIREILIEQKGAIELIESDSVFWLNKDGSIAPITIKRNVPSSR